MYVAVVIDPYNEASIEFHKQMGFGQAMRVVADDDKQRRIFYKSSNHVTETNIEILIVQYETAGFLLVATVTLENLSGINIYLIMTLISLIAVLTTYLFDITMRDGIDYLQKKVLSYRVRRKNKSILKSKNCINRF